MSRHLYYFAQNLGPAFESLPKPAANGGRVTTIISLILTVAGILAVLFVIIGAIRYGASRGNPDQVAQAKNTIIYALVGFVICMFALVIIRFVTGFLT